MMLVTLFFLVSFVFFVSFLWIVFHLDFGIWYFFLFAPVALCGTVGFVGSFALVHAFLNVKFIHNIPIKAYVDNKLVYKGVSACLHTETNGANTQVTVLGDPLCLKPINYYISKNVKIVKQGGSNDN